LSTDNDILNAISDLRQANDDKDELQTRIVKLKDELEGAEDDLQSTELEIERARDKLDQLIDDATGTKPDNSEPNYVSAVRNFYGD
jgi:chromosome segregation ATPase